MRFPCGDAIVIVEASAYFKYLRRPLGIPRVLVFARPLHAHRFSHSPRKQQRIGSRIVVPVTAVRTGTVEEYDAQLVFRNSEYSREVRSHAVWSLGCAPNRC